VEVEVLLSVGDGITTVSNVTGMTFSGASVVNNGDGNITINITGGTGTSGTRELQVQVVQMVLQVHQELVEAQERMVLQELAVAQEHQVLQEKVEHQVQVVRN
jgi:hypothetical protein